MNRKILMTAALTATSFLVACAPTRQVDAEALSGVVDPVLARHDAYVNADETLTDTAQETYLRSSAQIRAVLNEALGAGDQE